MFNLKTDLLPFDVMTFLPNESWSWNPMSWFGSVGGWLVDRGIQQDAKNFLGTAPGTNWQPVHAQIAFRPDKIYRAVPPKLCWDTVDQIAARGDKVLIFRMDPKIHVFTQAEADEMIATFETPTDYTADGIAKTETIIGSDYDTWTDVLIGLNSFLEHPDDDGAISVDNGSKLICSAGVALGIRRFQRIHNMPLIFSKIQDAPFKDSLWGPKVIEDYHAGKQLATDMVTPADLACTQTHYGHELIYMGQNF